MIRNLDLNLALLDLDVDLSQFGALGRDHPGMQKPFSDDVLTPRAAHNDLVTRWMSEIGATPQEIRNAITEDDLITDWPVYL